MSDIQATFSPLDRAHMAHALRLAERGLYTTAPNPCVGCVITHGEDVVGEGWHQRAGEAHAEVYALQAAGARADGATAYVTLEPCAHQGRTPPCVEALITAKLARVVVACRDPHASAGGGVERLQAAGIAVDVGLMGAQARELNRGFCSRIERGRPWLRVKLAMSLDARTALDNGHSRWITGEPARADVHRWRAQSSALLTGSGTVLADDPLLTVRLPEGEDFNPPLRVVLDTGLATRQGAHVLDGSVPTVMVHAQHARRAAYFDAVECLAVPEHEGHLDLHAVLGLLAQREINEVQVEAGAQLAGNFFAQGLVDELLLYIAPVLLGDDARPLLRLPALSDMAERWSLRVYDQRAVGTDWRLCLRPPVETL
ncbi:MAG: bifunctional diaminohydroxyphosphoribosylaminopyrimidine deaminase/5-amino-6-(5-phosphoribosylamino)uracil reductase RibD [Xanthomonadales bacterium]|nr:bifunctional diaminohydroxyphosphoribosylaminopyrimidine deaminase/5-amino-6-(5-phosphoribosylamino)uracil reductase RibD [Xanthomonadales bacterium]